MKLPKDAPNTKRCILGVYAFIALFRFFHSTERDIAGATLRSILAYEIGPLAS